MTRIGNCCFLGEKILPNSFWLNLISSFESLRNQSTSLLPLVYAIKDLHSWLLITHSVFCPLFVLLNMCLWCQRLIGRDGSYWSKISLFGCYLIYDHLGIGSRWGGRRSPDGSSCFQLRSKIAEETVIAEGPSWFKSTVDLVLLVWQSGPVTRWSFVVEAEFDPKLRTIHTDPISVFWLWGL